MVQNYLLGVRFKNAIHSVRDGMLRQAIRHPGGFFQTNMAVLSSEQECSLDDLIKERLKSCCITPKGMITGYLESKKAYDDLFRDLKVLGCRYSVRSCYAGKADSG